MSERIAVVTGASDGIGAEAARQLHDIGTTVVVVGRSPEKTKAVGAEIGAKHYVADYSRLSDVRRLADDLRTDLPHIDLLVNNAGGIFGERELTEDGHEKTMQVNHLAPFLLTNLLIDKLTASRATVINTSSLAAKVYSKFDISDLESVNRYTARIAYGNAKLENILFTRELHKRHHHRGLSAAAFHPGIVASNFASGTTGLMRFVYHSSLARVLLLSPAKGADTLVWLATTTPGVDWPSGEYFVKRKVSRAVDEMANDPNLAFRLWEQSAAWSDL
jgi:NAD(P)-dependent dehydrogenase (short-subunit alcohol dehydrogenase family)